MAKKNYNKISTEAKIANEEVVTEETVTEPVVDETPNETSTQVGIVTGCTKLNVRKKPNIEGAVLSVINEDTEVDVIGTSNKNFYEVTLADGTKGFCMKKYIKIK